MNLGNGKLLGPLTPAMEDSAVPEGADLSADRHMYFFKGN